MKLSNLHNIERMTPEIFAEVKKINQSEIQPPKKGLKSKKIHEILQCSPGTLEQSKINLENESAGRRLI